jgi:phenylacetate-CoA ligase
MRDAAVETLPWEEQAALDDAAWKRQADYLFARSDFYRHKLRAAGFPDAASLGGLAAIAGLPFTEKDELRASRTELHPIGGHLAAGMAEVVRVYSTSGTTGAPSYIPLTAGDLAIWIEISARSYAASGVAAGERLISTYGAGPFVAGAALDAFAALGLCHIPVGPGNTEKLLAAVEALAPDAIALTPSYALHLAEVAAARGIDLARTSVARLLVAGEPGGGEAEMRGRLEAAWGAQVTEAMGIGDVAVSLWGECGSRAGMHFSGRGFIHVELIDPETGAALAWEDGAEGELVYTHLRHRAAPLLRFRSRDHVRVAAGRCACGRTSPRVRCIGRTDDMLVVRGVNLFPTAVREVVAGFAPAVSGVVAIRPRRRGVRQEPPLPVAVELAEGRAATDPAAAGLAAAIAGRIRAALVVAAEVELVPWGSLPRSDYKSKLVDWSEAAD